MIKLRLCSPIQQCKIVDCACWLAVSALLQILKTRQEDTRLEKNSTKEETSSQFPKDDIGIKHKKVHDFVFNWMVEKLDTNLEQSSKWFWTLQVPEMDRGDEFLTHLFPCSQCMICGSFARTWRWWQVYMLINKQIHSKELWWVEGLFVASWTDVCYMWEDDWWTYDVIGSVQQDGLAVAGCEFLDSHDGIGICEIVFVA
jgi:hypothetical protein